MLEKHERGTPPRGQLHEYACDETVTGFWGMPGAVQDSGAPAGATALYVGVKKKNVTTPACGVVHIDVF